MNSYIQAPDQRRHRCCDTPPGNGSEASLQAAELNVALGVSPAKTTNERAVDICWLV
ncbi:MAG: hypothetical protein H7A45_16085 [Verrucomicrobiales bacterium]|nr:hypothetical protein [Verrucomicrobiales bacterium]